MVMRGMVNKAKRDPKRIVFTEGEEPKILRACQILVQAYATGQPLKVLPDEIAERTAQDWERITDFSIAHFEEMKRGLDAEDPSYAH